MNEIYNFIVHQLSTNQFFSGAALAGILGSALYSLKTVPSNLWRRIQRLILYSITVQDNDDLCYYLDIYVNSTYPKKLKQVEATIINGDVLLAHDNDWIWIRRGWRFIKIAKSRVTLENASSSRNRYSRSYSISGLFAKKTINKLITEVVDKAKKIIDEKQTNKKSVATFGLTYGEWRNLSGCKPKTFGNIFLSNKQEVLRDLENFKANKVTYNRIGTPFKRGYLFYGTPGNGKSSMASAIADYMKYDLYILDLSTISAGNMMMAFRNIPDYAVVVIEDIDTVFSQRKTIAKGTEVNFSAFLNMLSGISQKENVITIITTNHIEELDPALLREGRCDFKMKLENPTKEVAEEFLSNAFEQEVTLDSFPDMPFVKLQDIALRNINDLESCKRELSSLKSKNEMSKKAQPSSKDGI